MSFSTCVGTTITPAATGTTNQGTGQASFTVTFPTSATQCTLTANYLGKKWERKDIWGRRRRGIEGEREREKERESER